MVCQSEDVVCFCGNLNTFPGFDHTFAQDPRVKTTAANDRLLEPRVNGVQHIAGFALLGQFQNHAALKFQDRAHRHLLHVHIAHRYILANAPQAQRKTLRAQLPEELLILQAHGLQRVVVFGVIVPVAFKAGE